MAVTKREGKDWELEVGELGSTMKSIGRHAKKLTNGYTDFGHGNNNCGVAMMLVLLL